MSDSDTYLKIDTRYTVFYTFSSKRVKNHYFHFKTTFLTLKMYLNVGHLLKKMLFSVIGNHKIAKFIPVSVLFVLFIAILCACGSASEPFGHRTGVQDGTSTFCRCNISFTNFVCIACNVPCTRVLVRLRYVSSFPDTFQP